MIRFRQFAWGSASVSECSSYCICAPLTVGRKLTQLIANSKGQSNKNLAKLADQLKALMDKFEK